MMSTNNAFGGSAPSLSAARLALGEGAYLDDQQIPGQLHIAFVRSYLAHARIISIDYSEASKLDGVTAIFDGESLRDVCKPMHVEFAAFPDYKNIAQPVLAIDEVSWQGMPVVAIVAISKAIAEDAAELVAIEYEELEAIADPVAALELDAPVCISEASDNVAFDRIFGCEEIDEIFDKAAAVVCHNFTFDRQAGVPLEPRGIIAHYKPKSGFMDIVQSHQAPNQTREVIADLLSINPLKVSVRLSDVGGAFGVKLHAYPDEIATCAASLLLGRPIKFVADRMESFISDVQAREAEVTARLAVDGDGYILAFDVDVVSGLGAYSTYPRGSLSEGIQAVQLIGAPYKVPAARGRLRVAYQNKPPSGMYRGVGQPIAIAVTEQLMDMAAKALAIDPAEMRRRNFLPNLAQKQTTAFGLHVSGLSSTQCLEKLLETMDYRALREDQVEARKNGIYRGIGLSSFVELTAVGPGFYGAQKVSVASQEGCSLRLEPMGLISCETSVTDQGQGTLTGIAQIVAGTIGVPLNQVSVRSAGSDGVTYGGGAWASRGLAIGGEAALEASRTLRGNILEIAGALLQADPDNLDLVDGCIVQSGVERLSLKELSEIAMFRQHLLPDGMKPQLSVIHHHVMRDAPYLAANGIHGCHVEIDSETGTLKILGYWVVEDCGTVVNPLLVDGQIRGGVVQGVGAALYEHCVYDSAGQLTNASLADYAIPMAGEMPDIEIAHVETPAVETALGAKGAGEAGTIGAIGVMWTAVNDALAALGARACRQPFTPDRILEAILTAEAERRN